MSLCRLGPDSDLYIYPMALEDKHSTVYACHWCPSNPSVTVTSIKGNIGLLLHVLMHKLKGDKLKKGLIMETLKLCFRRNDNAI